MRANSESSTAEISIRHVWKRKANKGFDQTSVITLLSDVSVDFCGGCIQMIIGPSGSGKTTLLRLLNKLESPDEGKIFYRGKDYDQIPARQLRQEIGMVFQTPALFRGTIDENINYGPQLRRRKLSSEAIYHYLKIVGLADVEPSRQVEQLSLGQQQRISFARALANDPKVLLLDEPTAALDPTSANQLLDLIQKINSELGISVIMVTHVMEHALRIADQICFLVQGRVIECGSAASFFEHPQTELARKFIRGES